MSKKLLRRDALDIISSWDMSNVIALLQKNGLTDCCKAVTKRQIDGDELLHLTEGKLALWKSDLTRSLMRQLWAFVEQLNRIPESFVTDDLLGTQEYSSDADSWGTEFEDDPSDDTSRSANEDFTMLHAAARQTGDVERQDDESIYANCANESIEDNTYENFDEANNLPVNNLQISYNNSNERNVADRFLKQTTPSIKVTKPHIGPKPEIIRSQRIFPKPQTDSTSPQKSFLHHAVKTKYRTTEKMAVPPPPEPKRNSDRNRPMQQPMNSLKNFDLVANLPVRGDESEDENTETDGRRIERTNKGPLRKTSTEHLPSRPYQSSNESIHKPIVTNYNNDDDKEEYYESITETREDSGYYLSPISPPCLSQPPLPAKPYMAQRSKQNVENEERSPEKKSSTLSRAISNTSLSVCVERATRPLPPPPERLSYSDKPWFHNVTRDQAITLIKGQGTFTTPKDGYFLLRPSTTDVNSPLALVVWCKERVNNIPVRKRSDGRYALGSPKVKEESFATVEEMVHFYMNEELLLSTRGVQTGATRLTETPPK